jgi:hypothetical protein
MSEDLYAGLIIGIVAALPYLAFVVAGVVGVLRGGGTGSIPATFHITGAALGAIAGGVAVAHLAFFLLRWTGLSAEPSGFWWGVALAFPVLVVGWVGFLGTAQDEKQHRFVFLFAGLFLTIFGFCGLPLGAVLLLAGLFFGMRATVR